MSLIVLATGNPHKMVEITPLFVQAGYKTKPQTDFFDDEVHEDGLSFLENALKKARYASQKTGLPAIADDSGLEVEALGGQPGIYSARFAGNNTGKTTDEENVQKLLETLGDLPYEQRQARYSCAAVYVEHADDPMPIVGVGHWYGEILKERRTSFGVGYDPVFWVPKLVKSASEIPLEKKLEISHRTQAIQQVIAQLENKNK